MIVITTPTGHIGCKVLEQLLATDEKLRIIARDPAKLPAEAREKTEIVQGSLDDMDVLSKAYTGADQLFYIVPPGTQFDDVNQYYRHFATPTCEAIMQQKVKRVVYISGTGLGHEKNAGPVSASFLVEEALQATGAAVKVLHCGTFMENLLHMVQPIKYTGSFGSAVPADTKAPWVACQDIADAAVKVLVDKSWSGNSSFGVLGPDDISYNEISKIMSEVLGREILYNEVPGETLKDTMIQYGASEAAAQGLVDICNSMKNGVFNMVKRTAVNSSPTTFHSWCEAVLKPAILN